MKMLILFFSQTQYTRKVADRMRAGALESGADCELASIRDVDTATLHPYDLVVVGILDCRHEVQILRTRSMWLDIDTHGLGSVVQFQRTCNTLEADIGTYEVGCLLEDEVHPLLHRLHFLSLEKRCLDHLTEPRVAERCVSPV